MALSADRVLGRIVATFLEEMVGYAPTEELCRKFGNEVLAEAIARKQTVDLQVPG